MTRFRNFLIGFILPVLMITVICLPNSIFLYNAGEFETPENMAEALLSSESCLVGMSTSRYNVIDFKKEIYKIKKPEMIVVGSSRAMQFTSELFKGAYFNLGGMVGNVIQAQTTVNDLLAIHKPDLAVLLLDFWWFKAGNETLEQKHQNITQRMSQNIQALFSPFSWLSQGKVSLETYLDILSRGPNCFLGMHAEQNRQGFQSDGSYFYGNKFITPGSETLEGGLEKITESEGQYQHGTELSRESFDRFINYVDTWKNAGVSVIIVMPPVAPTIYEAMSGRFADKYEYVSLLRQELSENLDNFHDFHNPEDLGATDCEFIDAHHLGEIVSARILEQINSPELQRYLNTDFIERMTSQYAGLTVNPQRLKHHFPNQQEVDFLQIGCQKTISKQDR